MHFQKSIHGFVHVQCLHAWAPSGFTGSVEQVQRRRTELFHAFSLNYLKGRIARATGRLAETSVQGNCLFKVMGQETCQ